MELAGSSRCYSSVWGWNKVIIMNHLHEKCWCSLDSDWTSKTRDPQVSTQIRKCCCYNFQTLSLPSLKTGLVFSVVINHREKNLWLFCLLLCCFLSFPPSLQGTGSRAPHWSPRTAAQNVVHNLILSLGWTLKLCWCIGNIFLGRFLYNYYIIATVGLLRVQ